MNLWGWLWGCAHSNLTRPLTRKKREYVSGLQRPAGTFVCCLECGKEFEYDWSQMKIVARQRPEKLQEAEV